MNLEDLQNKIKNTDAIMIYFSGENCGVCHALQPKIKTAFDKNFPKIEQLYIKAEENKQIATHFGIFALPSIIVYFENKEFLNQSRLISVDQIVQNINRPYSLFFS